MSDKNPEAGKIRDFLLENTDFDPALTAMDMVRQLVARHDGYRTTAYAKQAEVKSLQDATHYQRAMHDPRSEQVRLGMTDAQYMRALSNSLPRLTDQQIAELRSRWYAMQDADRMKPWQIWACAFFTIIVLAWALT